MRVDRKTSDAIEPPSWYPSASVETLRKRAELLAQIRGFFAVRDILEVDTPALANYTVTDPYMRALSVEQGSTRRFLQTSPEYAMKRLLCAGSGDIYQLGKVYRSEEIGRKHQIEFTMLEWYRLGWCHYQLMDEVFELVSLVTGIDSRVDLSYQQCFMRYLGIDPFDSQIEALRTLAEGLSGDIPDGLSKDELLSLLFAFHIEPKLEKSSVVFVSDFPRSQASLARLLPNKPECAARFECFVNGIELANGFWELTDFNEQKERFEHDNRLRVNMGLLPQTIDHEFLDALSSGLPSCAGVALGVDRLLMVALDVDDIAHVVPFALN